MGWTPPPIMMRCTEYSTPFSLTRASTVRLCAMARPSGSPADDGHQHLGSHPGVVVGDGEAVRGPGRDGEAGRVAGAPGVEPAVLHLVVRGGVHRPPGGARVERAAHVHRGAGRADRAVGG